MSASFRTRLSVEERARRVQKIKKGHNLPIVLEKCTTFTGPSAEVTLFQARADLSTSELLSRISEKNAHWDGYAYFVDDGVTHVDTATTLQQLYDAHKDTDGFLYLFYGSHTSEEDAVAIDLTKPYREQVPFDIRSQKAALCRGAGVVPLVCEPEDWTRGEQAPYLYERVYSERRELTVGEFINNIKLRMSMHPTESLFLYVANKRIAPVSATLGGLHDKYAADDGFLYLGYSPEKTFG